jgi:A/G-specific adenine glycosylase
VKKLIDWSLTEHSHLPWRKERTLYRTLVSEVMLQQTTVGTVLNHFERFIKRFPDIFSLAKSSQEEVCLQWQGLGYYRRARNLHKGAQYIVENFNGEIPIDVNELLKVPGIGLYTSHALVGIGANQRALPVDANLERILSRLYLVTEEKGPKLQKKLLKLFEEKKILKNVQRYGYRKTYEALMDLGREFCQAKRAHCAQCL